jgi:hypothetical protein
MKRRCLILGLLLLTAIPAVKLAAQEAQVGVVLPVTISAGILDTGRAQADDPSAASLTAGFRVLATPQVKLGPHWFFYSAVQVYSAPFFYDDTRRSDRYIETRVLQGFFGDTRSWGPTSLGFKIGTLSSAFGAFPLRYDDAVNSLLDRPLSYSSLKLRPDQLPCGTADFSRAPGPAVQFRCGGAGMGSDYGVAPVTLYGLQGAEVDLSWRRLDARVQLTNSSPANPRSLLASSQHPQWTAGGGYTIRQGFRVGMSLFRGPWLDNAVSPYLPHGSSVTDFPASGLGVDVQWARGPWSANGEWQRILFRYPQFRTSPASSFGYVELKRIISPRWYSAFRTNYQANNHPVDSIGRDAATFLPNRQAYELAVGFRPDRIQLLKVGYEWMQVEGSPRTHDNVFGVQFVTSISAFSKALK